MSLNNSSKTLASVTVEMKAASVMEKALKLVYT